MRALASMLVELLPIEAWLLVLAADQGVPVNQAAAPFWALLAAMALAWGVAHRMRDASRNAALSAGVVPFLLTYLVLLRVSPAAYGNTGNVFDLSWLGTLASDLATSSHRLGALFGLLLLLGIIWWRGSALGTNPTSTSGNLRRFALCMAGLLIALVGAVSARPTTQDALSAALTLIVLGEVFVGLLDAALARIATVRQEGDASTDETPWVRTALVLAFAVIAAAFVFSLIFNFQSFLSLLNALGPLGAAISNFLTALLNVIIAGISRLLSLFDFAIGPLGGTLKTQHINDPQVGGVCKLIKGKLVCPHIQQSTGLSAVIVAALQLAGMLLMFAVIVWLVWVSLLRRTNTNGSQNEEREALDAQKLLAAQLRGLFSGRRRRTQQTEEALPRDSVRYLYREVLRAAKGHGLDRHLDETPDEFADRLGKIPPLAMRATAEGADLLALSDAYDDARYAGREPEAPQRERLVAATARLRSIFRGQDRDLQ